VTHFNRDIFLCRTNEIKSRSSDLVKTYKRDK